jgi:hypothetical protein
MLIHEIFGYFAPTAACGCIEGVSHIKISLLLLVSTTGCILFLQNADSPGLTAHHSAAAALRLGIIDGKILKMKPKGP